MNLNKFAIRSVSLAIVGLFVAGSALAQDPPQLPPATEMIGCWEVTYDGMEKHGSTKGDEKISLLKKQTLCFQPGVTYPDGAQWYDGSDPNDLTVYAGIYVPAAGPGKPKYANVSMSSSDYKTATYFGFNMQVFFAANTASAAGLVSGQHQSWLPGNNTPDLIYNGSVKMKRPGAK